MGLGSWRGKEENASRTPIYCWFFIIYTHLVTLLGATTREYINVLSLQRRTWCSLQQILFFRGTLVFPVIVTVTLLTPSLILFLSECFDFLSSLVLGLPKASSTECHTQLALYTCTFSQSQTENVGERELCLQWHALVAFLVISEITKDGWYFHNLHSVFS